MGRGGANPMSVDVKSTVGSTTDKCPQFLNARVNPTAQLAHAFTTSCNVSEPTSDWYLDSGTSVHMTSQTTALEKFEPYAGKGSMIVGNGETLYISCIGTSTLNDDVNLLDVLVMPYITKKLLSISKLNYDYPVNVVYSDKLFTI